MGIDTTAPGQAAEQRLAVGHGDRREDGYAWRHAATLPHGAGRKRLDMPTPGRQSGWRHRRGAAGPLASVRAAGREEPIEPAPGTSRAPSPDRRQSTRTTSAGGILT